MALPTSIESLAYSLYDTPFVPTAAKSNIDIQVLQFDFMGVPFSANNHTSTGGFKPVNNYNRTDLSNLYYKFSGVPFVPTASKNTIDLQNLLFISPFGVMAANNHTSIGGFTPQSPTYTYNTKDLSNLFFKYSGMPFIPTATKSSIDLQKITFNSLFGTMVANNHTSTGGFVPQKYSNSRNLNNLFYELNGVPFAAQIAKKSLDLKLLTYELYATPMFSNNYSASSISKIASILMSSVSKVSSVTVATIKKISGVSNI